MTQLKDIKSIFDLYEIMKDEKSNTFYNLKIELSKHGRYLTKKLELLNYIAENFEKIKDKVKYINLFVPFEKIPKEEFKYIFKLYNATKDDVPCYINVDREYRNEETLFDDKHSVSWDLKTIVKANTEIDSVCDFIKEQNFSPFEALAYIHNYVSTIANYHESQDIKEQWYSHDQFFPGIFEDIPEVVCAGYSSLMKEIIDNLNMPELKCKIISVSMSKIGVGLLGNHARCLIEIKDKKYGLNQTVFDDPTWDNDKNATCAKYAHFAMCNECHDFSLNKSYRYGYPHHFDLLGNKNIGSKRDMNTSRELYNKSKNAIDQKMIETAYATVMHKALKNDSPSDIYDYLKQMARESHKEQTSRHFEGNLKQSGTVLSKKDVYEICGKSFEREDEGLSM